MTSAPDQFRHQPESLRPDRCSQRAGAVEPHASTFSTGPVCLGSIEEEDALVPGVPTGLAQHVDGSLPRPIVRPTF